MKRIDKQHLIEQTIYLVIWLVVFMVPIIGSYYAALTNTNVTFNWSIVRVSWLILLPFLLLFIANNYLLAAWLLFKKKYLAYSASILGLIFLLFWFYPSLSHLEREERFFRSVIPPMKHSMMDHPVPRDIGQEECNMSDTSLECVHAHPKKGFRGKKNPGEFNRSDDFFMRDHLPIPVPLFVRIAIAILLVGFNISIKLMFKSLRDEQTLKELERERLQSELEYLKYQINPHFFMNTLNNIHALVDIDPAKAQKALVELSKLMRYVLYEASNKTILLTREIQFLSNYVELMKLRYINKVSIDVHFPMEVPEVYIPPLLFVSLIENAFKHGVSYQHSSFIQVLMELDGDKLIFRCSNSNWHTIDEKHHGIGLENIRKRLRLIFGNDYTLSMDENNERFNVLLIIPVLS